MHVRICMAVTACTTQTITNDSAAKTMSWNARNGLDHLCNLWVDQVTFPGTHNSGSGFDGLLYYYIGTAAGSCFYRNHAGKSFVHQLPFSIICSFGIDTVCSCAYKSSMGKALQQIDAWMKTHDSIVMPYFSYPERILVHIEGYKAPYYYMAIVIKTDTVTSFGNSTCLPMWSHEWG